jgi:hypothetical protein
MKNFLNHTGKPYGLALISVALLATLYLAVPLFNYGDTSYAQQPPSNAPVGSIVAWSGPTNKIPSNWLVCDGRPLDRRGDYEGLFNAIGTSWGGTATDKFNIPDLRGLFLRGVDAGAGRDPDVSSRTPVGTAPATEAGSTQQDTFASHNHNPVTISPNPHNHGYREPGGGGSSGQPGRQGLQGATTGDANLSGSMENRGGTETRPKNAYVYWIIRAK